MNSLFIFSLDGVLIDSKRDLFTSINMVRSDFELDAISIDQFKYYICHDRDKYILRCVGRVNADSSTVVALFYKYYKECMFDSTKLYIGVLDGIKKLHSVNHRLAVLSSKPTHIVDMLLSYFGLAQYMFMIVGEGGDHPVKPDPNAIPMMCHEAETNDNSVWYISDNEQDLFMGRKSGVRCAFSKYGYGNSNSDMFDLKIMSFIDFEKFIDCSSRF